MFSFFEDIDAIFNTEFPCHVLFIDIDPILPDLHFMFCDGYESHTQVFQKKTDLRDCSVCVFSETFEIVQARNRPSIFSKMIWGFLGLLSYLRKS